MSTRSPLVLSVFFEGTGNTLKERVTQIGLLATITKAHDLKSQSFDQLRSSGKCAKHFKIAYDGCGVTHGTTGVLFAAGLRQQCCEVVGHVRSILRHIDDTSTSKSGATDSTECKSPPSECLVVNAVGLSRGGIAVIFLAQMLSKEGFLAAHLQRHLQVNLLLFDPVPGNLIGPSRLLSPLGCRLTTATASMDLTGCPPLRHVLALYPYEPLPDLAFHAPVLPTYDCSTGSSRGKDGASGSWLGLLCGGPRSTNTADAPAPAPAPVAPATATAVWPVVEEDAVLGCHQGALLCRLRAECVLSFTRCYDWLQDRGTLFHLPEEQGQGQGQGQVRTGGDCDTSLALRVATADKMHLSPAECLRLMTEAVDLLRGQVSVVRGAHSRPAGGSVRKHCFPKGDESDGAGAGAGNESRDAVTVSAERGVVLNRWHAELLQQSASASGGTTPPQRLLLEVKR